MPLSLGTDEPASDTVGSIVYVGRAAPQQKSALYGGKRHGDGGFQFRLTVPPEQVFRSMKRYTTA
jgi:hypothetical protein